MKIVIASVLKPVTDPRMFEKIAHSLEETAEIHIVGFKSQYLPKESVIEFHELFDYYRLSPKRALANPRFFLLLCKLRPELVICCTAELLPAVTLYRLLFWKKVIYDVQENYFRNVWYQPHFPFFIRGLLAPLIRFIELVCAPFISEFWLAERVYLKQLPFSKKKMFVVENLYRPGPVRDQRKPIKEHSYKFLIAGTITDIYGSFEGIQMVQNLQRNCSKSILLKVIGHCVDKNSYKQLLEKQDRNVEKDISLQPIPHERVLAAMLDCDFLLLPYLPNKSTEGKIPTKFFEAFALKIPMIIQRNHYWEELLKDTDCAIFINYLNEEYPSEAQLSQPFYQKKCPSFLWDDQFLRTRISKIAQTKS